MMKSLNLTKKSVIEALCEVGVRPGDIILVHSDTSQAMRHSAAGSWEEALPLLQESFLSAVGTTGTLVVPTFYYDFCRGKPYVHEESPSQVGLFTNHIRLDKRTTRSFHPIFSFAAIGAHAHQLCDNLSRSSFGRNSVFQRLLELHAKIVFYNVSFESSCSFVHFVEQQANVEYRYLKYFTGKVSVGKKEYIDTFDYYVRYLDRDVQICLDSLGEQLRNTGLIKQAQLEEGYLLQVSCDDVYREALRSLKNNPYFLLSHPPKPFICDPCITNFKNITTGPLEEGKKDNIQIKDIVKKIYPLHRTLVSDGTDAALDIIGQHLGEAISYVIETYAPTKPVWTWRVPERYVVHEAYLETEDKERIVDFKDNPLHLVSYSLSINKILSWEELQPHLYYSVKRPCAIPWEFKYYERDWGFCITKEQFDRLHRGKRYHAVIRSDFIIDPEEGLRVGVAVLHPESGQSEDAGEILVCVHICHPFQANDDAAGVAVAVEIARRLSRRPLPQGSKSVRFLFCPETIGSISYLSHHEDLIARFTGGIFVEMPGNRNKIALQRTRQDNHLLDKVARYVLKSKGKEFIEGSFRQIIGNDEMVINGPGVNIPCISISRWPYDEYHTSDDNPGIIHEEMLIETADIVEEVIRIFATDYVPYRTFKGPVFLSRYGLWVDWRVNKKLNQAIDKIMLSFEGEQSVFEIAQELNLDYWEVWGYVQKFYINGLVQPRPRWH